MIQSLFLGVVFLSGRLDQTTRQVFIFILNIETYENCYIIITVIILCMFKNFFIEIVISINLFLNDSIIFLVRAVYFISKLDFFTCGFSRLRFFQSGAPSGGESGKL